MGNSENQPGGEPDHNPLEMLLDRYIANLAVSAENITDLLPIIFYDNKVLSEAQIGRRLRALSGIGLNSGFDKAIQRYEKLDEPPLEPSKGRWNSVSPLYNINRRYFETQSFYQSSTYQQMYGFLVKRLQENLPKLG